MDFIPPLWSDVLIADVAQAHNLGALQVQKLAQQELPESLFLSQRLLAPHAGTVAETISKISDERNMVRMRGQNGDPGVAHG